MAIPWTAAHQAPLSMGSPRQEYWKWKWKALSHVPFFETPWTVYSPLNSPGQNTEVSRVSYSRGTSLLQKNPPGDLPNPGIQPRPRSIVHGVAKSRTRLSDFHLRILEWTAVSFSKRDLPNPGIKSGSPALQADSLPFEPQGSPWDRMLKIKGFVILVLQMFTACRAWEEFSEPLVLIHFKDEEIEIHRNYVTCARPYSKLMTKARLHVGFPISQSVLFQHHTAFFLPLGKGSVFLPIKTCKIIHS